MQQDGTLKRLGNARQAILLEEVLDILTQGIPGYEDNLSSQFRILLDDDVENALAYASGCKRKVSGYTEWRGQRQRRGRGALPYPVL